MSSGVIFDIKEFTVHDGPGIRTTVFLKGCPLSCVWCHNPEGISKNPQLMVAKSGCVDCGECKKKCNHEQCRPFNRCVMRCARGNIKVCGESISSQKLAERLTEQSEFFADGSGGITFSGGEPLLQPDFLCETLELLKPLNRIIETSGYASRQVFERAVSLCDEVFMDIKHPDEQAHKKYTGVSNKPILENLNALKESGVTYTIRVPLIPGINADQQTVDDISRLFKSSGDNGRLKRVEFLPYNEFANAKHSMLDMPVRYTPRRKINYSEISFDSFLKKGINAVLM